MKKWLILSLPIAFFGLSACDSDLAICHKDSECQAFCRAYATTDLLYACTDEGTCKCVDSEELECDPKEEVDEGEKTHCEKLCPSVKPGSVGACKNKQCVCTMPGQQSSEEETHDEA